MPIILIHVILMCIVYVFFIYKKKQINSYEDFYQVYRKNINKETSIIDVVIEAPKLELDSIVLNMKQALCNFNIQYNKTYNNKIEQINMFDDIVPFKSCTEFVYKAYVDKNTGKIYCKFNHELLGGSNLGKITFTINRVKQPNLFLESKLWHSALALRLWLNKNNLPKTSEPLPLIQERNDILRYTAKYSFERCKTISTKGRILYNILKDLYTCLALKRQLVCYLPIAFQNTPDAYNNIGLIWITYDPYDTEASIEKQLNDNAYQALATNFILRNKLHTDQNVGSNVRKNVDAVITIIFSSDTTDLSCSWTFKNISEYPVYVAVSSRLSGNTVMITQTLTVSTPAFNIDKSENEYMKKETDYFLIE